MASPAGVVFGQKERYLRQRCALGHFGGRKYGRALAPAQHHTGLAGAGRRTAGVAAQQMGGLRASAACALAKGVVAPEGVVLSAGLGTAASTGGAGRAE